MALIDLLVSNDRHHRAMSWPVAAGLARDGDDVRVLSLCELRGLSTPPPEQAPREVELRRVLPLRLRRSPASLPAARPGSPSAARRTARALVWRLLLAPRLAALWRHRPQLVVLPNDAAFPFDRIARLLHGRRIPFLLLQEGIRFPLTGQTGEPVYGTGGATAVAAWGQASADYFRDAGVPPERIHLTGSPRFDRLEPRSTAATGCRSLLLASNPIDDQGLCSHREKLRLIERFLAELQPLFADPDFRLAIKLHGREDPQEFRQLVGAAVEARVSIHTDAPLDRVLGDAGAVVVLASTVGLEALLHGVPLAVLEIPGQGFQYDYVDSGAAAGLTWSAPMAPQVGAVFEPSARRQADVDVYLQRQLATRHWATRRVVALIRELLGETR